MRQYLQPVHTDISQATYFQTNNTNAHNGYTRNMRIHRCWQQG